MDDTESFSAKPALAYKVLLGVFILWAVLPFLFLLVFEGEFSPLAAFLAISAILMFVHLTDERVVIDAKWGLTRATWLGLRVQKFPFSQFDFHLGMGGDLKAHTAIMIGDKGGMGPETQILIGKYANRDSGRMLQMLGLS